MKTFFYLLLFYCITKCCDDCQNIQGQLKLKQQYYNDNPLLQKDSKDMKIILNKGEYSSIIDESGKFVLYNIPPGSYILETTSRILRFDTLFIEVPPYHPTKNSIKAFSLNFQARKKTAIKYPIELDLIDKYQYFQIVEPWTIWTLLKNPYMIMIGVTCVMLFLMKKMPSYEELQEQQQSVQQQQGPAQQHQHQN